MSGHSQLSDRCNTLAIRDHENCDPGQWWASISLSSRRWIPGAWTFWAIEPTLGKHCFSAILKLAYLIRKRKKKVSRIAVSTSLPSHGLWPSWLLCPRNSPGKSTGVSCHFFLQGNSQPRDQTCTAGRFFTNWATRKVLTNFKKSIQNF